MQTFPTTVGGLVGLNRPAVQRSEGTAMKIYAYLIWPAAGLQIQRPHWKQCSNMPRGRQKKKISYIQYMLLVLTLLDSNF